MLLICFFLFFLLYFAAWIFFLTLYEYQIRVQVAKKQNNQLLRKKLLSQKSIKLIPVLNLPSQLSRFHPMKKPNLIHIGTLRK